MGLWSYNGENGYKSIADMRLNWSMSLTRNELGFK